MEHSESMNELAAAMVLAQGEITGAAKDSTNPHFRSQYADLSSVMEACKGALNRNGIAVLQSPAPSEHGTLAIDTVLLHKSGQWSSGRMVIPLPKNDPQGFGSAMTYARRYSLAAMVGVTPEDDDGEGAMPKGQQRLQQRTAPKPNGAPDALSDDDNFRATVGEALAARGFLGPDILAVEGASAKSKRVNGIIALPLAARHGLLVAIAEGKFDKLKTAAEAAGR